MQYPNAGGQFGVINYPKDTNANSYEARAVEIKTEDGSLYNKIFTDGTVNL